MRNIGASDATTMKNTDTNKAETMVISLDVNPKITQKSWKETNYSLILRIKNKALEKNDYCAWLLDCQVKPRRISQDT